MIKFTPQLEALQAKINALGNTSPGVLRAVDAFARVLRTRIQLGFRTTTTPEGSKWKPLNTFFRSGTPLRNTGSLYRSIGVRREGNAVVVGTNLKVPGGTASLGAVHQFGAVIKPKPGPGQTFRGRLLGPIRTASKGFVFLKKVTIPARRFMPVDPAGNVNLPPAWAASALQAMGRALEPKDGAA